MIVLRYIADDKIHEHSFPTKEKAEQRAVEVSREEDELVTFNENNETTRLYINGYRYDLSTLGTDN